MDALASLHGMPKRSVDPLDEVQGCHGQVEVLDSLVRTMLSQNTTDKTSIRAFKSLKEHFPTWDDVLNAPNKAVEESIRVGGLAAIKTQRIKDLLEKLREERDGKISLEWLKEETTEYVKEWLSELKGVGPKTVSCVLLFCLNRPDFPVDTHVWNISRHMGWCPPNVSREDCYLHMNKVVPNDFKFELHVLLVEHGKTCGACRKGGRMSKVNECPLAKMKRQGMFKRVPSLHPTPLKREIPEGNELPFGAGSKHGKRARKSNAELLIKEENDCEIKDEPPEN